MHCTVDLVNDKEQDAIVCPHAVIAVASYNDKLCTPICQSPFCGLLFAI